MRWVEDDNAQWTAKIAGPIQGAILWRYEINFFKGFMTTEGTLYAFTYRGAARKASRVIKRWNKNDDLRKHSVTLKEV